MKLPWGDRSNICSFIWLERMRHNKIQTKMLDVTQLRTVMCHVFMRANSQPK